MQIKNVPVRSLVLLAVLITVGVFLRGLVTADPAFDVNIEQPEKSSYLLGETVRIPGSVEVFDAAPGDADVTLRIDGPQPATQTLPVSPGVYTYPDKNLEVTVSSSVVSSTIGTLPGGGPGDGTLVEYDVAWTPPLFLDPAPEFTILPETTDVYPIPAVVPDPLPGEAGIDDLPSTVSMFDIPTVGQPAPGQPSALPGADMAFAVPVVPTPTPGAGAAAPLPSVEAAYAIPEVPTAVPDPGAPADLPALTEAFDVPVVPTASPEAGAPADLPTITEAFDVPTAPTPTAEAGAVTPLDQSITTVFSIPTAPTPGAVAGAAELPSTTEMFSIPGANSPRAIATDGTDFYILVDGSPDQILKVNATGTLDTTFDTDGIIDVTHNTDNRNEAEGLAVVSGKLYVAEGSWRDSEGGYSLLKFDATTGAESDISAGDNSCAIPNQDRFSGIHADGTRLWGVVDWGGKFVKITTNCTQVTSYDIWPHPAAHGLAVGSGDHPFFFVSEGETIAKRSKDDASATGVTWTLTDFIIKGLAYDGGLLYIADADSNKVYKTNIPHGQTITTDPRGVAYDGTNLYILVDASPNDKIVVVDPTDAADPPTIIRSFDAPGSGGDSLTYSGGFLWLGQSSGCCDREIKKIDPQAGNVASTLTLDNPIWNALGGLGYDGTDLIGFTKDDRGFYTISKTDGSATYVEGTSDQNGYHAGTYRTATSRAYAARDNKIYEFLADGEVRQTINLSPVATDVKGMTFVDANLYFADDDTNTIYRGSIPHGISVTTDPLALAAQGTSTLYILVDGTPRDKILVVDPTTGTTTSSYDAPDSEGAGLTYMGSSLYYASNAGTPVRILQLNPATGAEQSSINPQYTWGDIHDNIIGLSNDGSDLIVSTSRDDFWNQCLEIIDPATGNNQGGLCSGGGTGLGQARGVAVAPDEFVLIAQNDELVQLNPEGMETNRWSNLIGSTDVNGLTFVGNTLYLADDDNDKIYKTTVPSGIQITTDPLALAYGTASGTTTLFILVDAAPVDKILLVDPDDGTLDSSYDAPNDKGEALTYLGGSLYYASNKDNNRKVFQLNPDTGAQMSSFNPQAPWGDLGDNLLGMGNDGSDLIISTNNPFDRCLFQVDSGSGSNEGQLCPDFDQGLDQAAGLTVAQDDFIVVARDNEIVQLSPEGQETSRWSGLVGGTDIQGLTYVSSTLYVADDDTDKIYKTTVPSLMSLK